MTDRLTEVVPARFTAAERADLERYANGRPISHALRELAMRSLRARPAAQTVTENHGGPLLVTCSHPGATFATRPGFILSG